MLRERRSDGRDHLGVENVRLRAREPQAQQRAVAVEPNLQRRAHFFFAFGWMLSCSGPTQLSPAASFCRSSTKSTSRSSFGPSLNAVKPARASVIMLSASHAREFSLLRFHASSFGLRSSSSVLVVQSGNVSSIFAQSSSTFASSSDRSTVPRASSALPAFSASPVFGSPKTKRPYSSTIACVSTSGLATNAPSTFSAGTRSVSTPIQYALCAENGSQSTHAAIARSAPAITGRKSVAPPIGAEPFFGPA